MTTNLPIPPGATTFYVSPSGNDTNNGLSFFEPFATIQKAVQTAVNGGTVILGGGTYVLSTPVNMLPNITLRADNTAVITQANNSNLYCLISCTNANNCRFYGLTLNGNSQNNSFTSPTIGILVDNANDCWIQNCIIQNCTNDLIRVGNGLRCNISNNKLSNTNGYGAIKLLPSAAQTNTDHIVANNTLTGVLGSHPILIGYADGDVVTGNIIRGTLISGLKVNLTAGSTTVTATTGTFSNVVAGYYIIADASSAPGGFAPYEMFVTKVNSPISLTISSPSSFTVTNANTVAGPGDMISVGAASRIIISNNSLSGGAGGGVIVSDEYNIATIYESLQMIQINNNQIWNFAGAGISIQTGNYNNASIAFNNMIVGNMITNCGVGNASGIYGSGIAIQAGGNTLKSTFIDGNFVYDNQSPPTTQYWCVVNNSSNLLQTFFGKNTGGTVTGLQHDGILNGATATLTGWGTGSSVTNLVAQGDGYTISIHTGTSPVNNPTIRILTNATTATQPPVLISKIVADSSGTYGTLYGEQNTDFSQILLTYKGIPPSSATLVINVLV